MSDVQKEQCVVIKFLTKNPADIYRKLLAVFGSDCLTQSRVCEWTRRFKAGRESVEADEREGAPKTVRTDVNIERLRVLVQADRRLTIRMLSEELGINKETVRQMLHENLSVRKLCAKLVPKV